jgi:SAM-dependent methyltransferase
MPYLNQYLDPVKRSLGWLFANGQTMRWVTEQIVIRTILESGDFPGFFNSLSAGTSLDVGCAGGRYLLNFLVPRSTAVIGVEYSESHIRLANHRAANAGLCGKVKIFRANAEALPLADRSVDFALCTQVLEHLPCPRKGIEELARTLRVGGRGILSIPIPPDPISNPEHLHKDFMPHRLDELVVASGFRILQRAFSMYALSRAIAWLVGTVQVPLPLNPLCYLEQATSRFVGWPNPHVYICVIERVIRSSEIRAYQEMTTIKSPEHFGPKKRQP